MKAKRTRRSANNTRRKSGQLNPRRWSAHVMKTSDALDLESGVFTQRSPHAIAASLRLLESVCREDGNPQSVELALCYFAPLHV